MTDRLTASEAMTNVPKRTDAGPDRKTVAIARILRDWVPAGARQCLVVGCGNGREAAVLAEELGVSVIGIDLLADFAPDAAARVTLMRGDATALQFGDRSFDIVYSYHALEHIPDYTQALGEMERVLKTGGAFCVGTPNRHRLVGYVGSRTATCGQKLRWNAADWAARLRGRFRNEYGAHAGFSSGELCEALVGAFGMAEEVTSRYYIELYSRHAKGLKLLARSSIAHCIYPSIYFIGRSW